MNKKGIRNNINNATRRLKFKSKNGQFINENFVIKMITIRQTRDLKVPMAGMSTMTRPITRNGNIEV